MRSNALILLCVVAAAGLVGCGQDETGSTLELPKGDACGDAYFWAVTESGDVAVTVTVEAKDRSHLDATTLEFVLPDAGVEVEVLEGENLGRNFCTDLPDPASDPRSRQVAAAGEGKLTLDPAPGGPNAFTCGTVTGELELNGLVAKDGTTFAPIRITSDSIGCYAG